MDASNKAHIGEVSEVGDSQDVSISICRIKCRRVKVAAKVNQRKLSKPMSYSCHLKYYKQESLSTTSSDQGLIPSNPRHAIFEFLVPLLISVLQVEYQNKQQSPTDAHPVQMQQTYLTGIRIYSATLGIKIYTQIRSGYLDQILSFVLVLSGSLSSASPLSILLHRLLLWVLPIIWELVPIILTRRLLKSSVCWILGSVAKLSWAVIDFMFSTMVSIFDCEASTSEGNNTWLTDRVEGI